jgi:hypothetical protein
MNAAEARAPVEVVCTVCGFGSGGEWTSRAADRQPINCPTSRGGCGAKVRVKRTQARPTTPARAAEIEDQAPAQDRRRTPAAQRRPSGLRPPRARPPVPAPRAPTPQPITPPAPYREPRVHTEGHVRPVSQQYCEECKAERRRTNSGLWPKATVHIEVTGAQQIAAYLCAKCFRSVCKSAPPDVTLHVTEIPTGQHYQLRAS